MGHKLFGKVHATTMELVDRGHISLPRSPLLRTIAGRVTVF